MSEPWKVVLLFWSFIVVGFAGLVALLAGVALLLKALTAYPIQTWSGLAVFGFLFMSGLIYYSAKH